MKPKTLEELNPIVLEALCVHSMLRKAGFRSEDCYLIMSGEQIAVCVHPHTDKEFVINIGTWPGITMTKLSDVWSDATALWNDSTQEQARKVWDASRAKESTGGFLLAYRDKFGIMPPTWSA